MNNTLVALALILVSTIAHAQLAAPELLDGHIGPTDAAAVQSSVAQPSKVKRLKRRTQEFGLVDDHICTLERRNRQEDYLAELSAKEINSYLKMAQAGDADAMYLLALIPVESSTGGAEAKREYPYRHPWLARSAAAGHPIAKYLAAEEAYLKNNISDDSYLALIEAAALAQGSGDIAWRLAFSYKNPTAEKGDVIYKVARNFLFLKGDKAKALHWARVAAAKGNMMAAEDLCSTMYAGTTQFTYGFAERDLNETVRWCTLAAQAMCSSSAALTLSGLYRDGIGLPKSSVDALYWLRISKERFRKNSVPIGKFEYTEGSDYEK